MLCQKGSRYSGSLDKIYGTLYDKNKGLQRDLLLGGGDGLDEVCDGDAVSLQHRPQVLHLNKQEESYILDYSDEYGYIGLVQDCFYYVFLATKIYVMPLQQKRR